MIIPNTRRAAAGLALTLAVGLLPVLAAPAAAHPDAKHGSSGDHLPPKQQNVRLVGEAAVAPRPSTTPLPAGTTNPLQGRIADVNVFGNFAYLAAFREPTCENGGVFVVDITDPTAPKELPEAFIPSSPGTYVGEGVQVIQIGARDVLLFNQEPCSGATVDAGFSLIDVTNPRQPVPLKLAAGDKTQENTATPTATIHSVHSVFGWTDNGRAYAVAVDGVDERDIDIFDISNPSVPVLLSETSFVNDPRVRQANPPNGDSQFLHDAVVKEINGRQTMLASYWDNGYLILDVEDPANPQFLRDTDFAPAEPFAARLGLPQSFEPEGNAHQAEFSPNNEFLIGTDEDFNPFRVTATVKSGPNTGTQGTAANGSGTAPVDDKRTVAGPTTFVGLGCDPASVPQGAATATAIIERGACSFQLKFDNAVAKGFGAVVVFNSTTGCEALINPLVNSKGSSAPFVFVARSTGLAILNQTPTADPCTQSTPPPGTSSADIDIRAVFDGWGYVHLYDAKTMADLGQFAIPESLDPAFASGFGDLSVHEVAMDPKIPGRAYLSYYSGGFRVIEYDRTGIREIGAYIDPKGSNHWGVEYWTSPTTGQDYVLASDRDFGLQIFQYAPGAGSSTGGTAPPANDPPAATSPTASPSASPSTSPATVPPSAGTPQATGSNGPPAAACAATSVQLERTTITATGSTGVTVRTAPNSVVDLFAYTQPSRTFRIVRSAEVSGSGLAEFRISPPANTRLYAQQRGCPVNAARDSVVVNVRTALSLQVTRTGPRTYTFSGDSLPARAGGLIVSLYRVTASGSQVLTAQTRANATNGEWRIDRRFTGTGRFGFVVRTGQDLQNAPGSSNVRSVLVF